MTNSFNLNLRARNQNANNRMLAIIAIGLLHSLEMGHIQVKEVQACMFNPYTRDILQVVGADPRLIELWHESLFLEDLEAHFQKEVLNKTIAELKQVAFQVLDQSQFDPHTKNKWAIVK
jgi:hypothetical protein